MIAMSRMDYYDDPNAPTPNSIVVAVTAFVQDVHRRVLLIHRTDNRRWALPGGALDIGENVATAAIRETNEETGLDIEVVGVVGIYSDPRHVIAYGDGEVRQEFSICLRAKCVGGDVRASTESSEVEWLTAEQMKSLSIDRSMRLRIDHALEDRTSPYIG